MWLFYSQSLEDFFNLKKLILLLVQMAETCERPPGTQLASDMCEREKALIKFRLPFLFHNKLGAIFSRCWNRQLLRVAVTSEVGWMLLQQHQMYSELIKPSLGPICFGDKLFICLISLSLCF